MRFIGSHDVDDSDFKPNEDDEQTDERWLPGQIIQTTEHYAKQFPNVVRKNGGEPLLGRIIRVRTDGLLVVKFTYRVTECILHPDFVVAVATPNPKRE